MLPKARKGAAFADMLAVKNQRWIEATRHLSGRVIGMGRGASPTIAREFYIARPAIAADVAHVLQELATTTPDDPDPGRSSDPKSVAACGIGPGVLDNSSRMNGELGLPDQASARLRIGVSAGQRRFFGRADRI